MCARCDVLAPPKLRILNGTKSDAIDRCHLCKLMPSTLIHASSQRLTNKYTDAPLLKGLNLPPFILHWFHALNMGVVLFAMGGYGTFLGWNMR